MRIEPTIIVFIYIHTLCRCATTNYYNVVYKFNNKKPNNNFIKKMGAITFYGTYRN